MENIKFQDFLNVELRSGTITKILDFPEACNPAYKIWVDFGQEFGIKKTSAQITSYTKKELIWKQIIWVLNFPPKQVWNFMSEFLLTAFVSKDWKTTLASIDWEIENGEKLV